MSNAPIAGLATGLAQVCTVANTDYPVAIPVDDDGSRAKGLIVWFEKSASDATVIAGRVAFGENATALTGITGSDTAMGYHPPQAVEYDTAIVGDFGDHNRLVTHVHLACATAGAVARGMWTWSV